MATSRTSPLRPSIRLSPVHSRENSRSASPERNPTSLYQKIDPLLSNLSPESTLHALTSTEAVPSNGNFSHNVLSQSISQVSPAERALGIRAAIAAQNLDIWYKEVQSWIWPKHGEAKLGKGFEPPPESSSQENSVGSSSLLLPPVSDGCDVKYYGSLPAAVVEEYEKRIEEIRDGMDNLDVDELKEHVLNAHIPSRSRPSSSHSTVSVPPPLSYVQLSDFTAVVTATILRALPLLSRLNSLLTTWDVRLLVLRQVPGLLRELKATRASLDSSFHALRISNPNENSDSRLSDSHLRGEHVDLESAVVAVGRRMDRALDALEGRQDSLPENWIDDLESIESEFAAWVVEAERYRLRTNWLRMKDQPMKPETIEIPEVQHEAPPLPEIADSTENAAIAAEIDTQPERESLNKTIEEVREDSVQPQTPALSEKQEPQQELEQSIASPIERTPELPASSDLSPSSPSPCSGAPDAVLTESAKEQLPASSDLRASSPSPCSETPDVVLTPPAKEQMPVETSLTVTEDMQTPTRPTFSFNHAVDISNQDSPSRVPLPMTPDGEDKENVPPLDYNQEQPVSSGSKPAALSEHNFVDDDDPFVQKPAFSGETEIKKTPVVSIADVISMPELGESLPEVKAADESVCSIQDDTSKDSLVIDHQPVSPKDGMVKQITVASEPSDRECVSAENRNSETCLTTTEKVEVPTIDVCPADTPNYTQCAWDPFQEISREPTQQPEPMEPAISESRPVTAVPGPRKENPPQEQVPTRKPLQSPIKLSKHRPGKLNLDKDAPKPRRHQRRSSTGSVGSLLSDNSSLISSPEAPEPQTGSSHEGPLVTPSRQDFPRSDSIPSHGEHLLRADRLLRFENEKSSPAAFPQTRAVSLPLERFINDEFDLDIRDQPELEATEFASSFKGTGVAKPPHTTSTPAPQVPPRVSSRRPRLTRGKSASDLKESENSKKNLEYNRKAFGMNTAHRALLHQEQPKSVRLRQRLTAHPSLESLGVKRQELPYVEEDESELIDEGSRPSSPHRRRPRDQLDEKINSILSTLPGRIHLVDPNNEADTSSSSSSMDRKMRDRGHSESPRAAPSRSMTPAPSLMLMPAARRRLSHAHKAEDSYVKLYHLHHGGQTAPTKLFVRTVGEDGQRVMVRVGGGWADLGEYLREYVIHHGRRKVSETPRVEVQGLTSRTSPGYSSPAAVLSSAAASPYITSGRATPSRPPSVMSARPPSSLTVRKRRSSNASDALGPRSVTTGTLSSYISPPPVTLPGGRRFSMSSNYSFGGTHSPANFALASLAHDSQSTPLGLAGPKPRSRQISMSPEGEAWVEDVLQQTRRSSSVNPPSFALNVAPGTESVMDLHEADDQDHSRSHSRRSLPKVSSISDIRSVGSSKRVSLRGLSNRR
ncbi:uncharacterized protein N7496_007925 [Penicillium cataractarum]|uniref:GAR domain-containing protein n=1 Tax=Penicillium cataractarum TaxID=2100454 RepID=A0A9W9RXM1_9EURO|nr:uncharacterized protein N7496_007925 [Penicillium cataractarum]KAJ5368165.1 hypothetical protein N7496_007925 [Penicillium cataractarum]